LLIFAEAADSWLGQTRDTQLTLSVVSFAPTPDTGGHLGGARILARKPISA
jgi:hypothetical protein